MMKASTINYIGAMIVEMVKVASEQSSSSSHGNRKPTRAA
jgi:hypothetical protein